MLVCWWKLLFLSELWKILIFYNINKDVSNYIFYVETFYWIYLFSVFRWLKLYKKLTWNFVSKIRPLFSPWVCGMSDFSSKTLRRFLSKIKKLCRRQSMFSLLHALETYVNHYQFLISEDHRSITWFSAFQKMNRTIDSAPARRSFT